MLFSLAGLQKSVTCVVTQVKLETGRDTVELYCFLPVLLLSISVFHDFVFGRLLQINSLTSSDRKHSQDCNDTILPWKTSRLQEGSVPHLSPRGGESIERHVPLSRSVPLKSYECNSATVNCAGRNCPQI